MNRENSFDSGEAKHHLHCARIDLQRALENLNHSMSNFEDTMFFADDAHNLKLSATYVKLHGLVKMAVELKEEMKRVGK